MNRSIDLIDIRFCSKNSLEEESQLDSDAQSKNEEIGASIQSSSISGIHQNQRPMLFQPKRIENCVITLLSEIGLKDGSSDGHKLKTFKRVKMSQQLLGRLTLKFVQYQEKKQKKNGTITLKSIAGHFDLGYRTVLKKYKEFKQSKSIDCGVRLRNEPLCYQNARQLVCLIFRSCCLKKFKNTNELCRFIQERFKVRYKRSRVSRYLSRLKFLDSLSGDILDKVGFRANHQCLRVVRELMANKQRELLYYGEREYIGFQGSKISLLGFCGSKGFLYQCKIFSSKEQKKEAFMSLLKGYVGRLEVDSPWFLISGVEEVYGGYYCNLQVWRDEYVQRSILKLQGRLFCLPLGFSNLNLSKKYLEMESQSLKDGLKRRWSVEQLQVQLQFYRRTFEMTFPLLSHALQQKLSHFY